MCVACGGGHQRKDCTTLEKKCANCGGEHSREEKQLVLCPNYVNIFKSRNNRGGGVLMMIIKSLIFEQIFT